MNRQPESAAGAAVGSLASVDRRTFICVALGLVATWQSAGAVSSPSSEAPSSAGSKASLGRSAGKPPGLSQGALLTTLSDPSAAGWLGQHYLAEYPQERDVNRLIDQLKIALHAQPDELLTARVALQQALINLIQHEYVSARLVSVDGWLLAPSEARLYALAALVGKTQRVHAPASLSTPRPASLPGNLPSPLATLGD